MPPPEIPTNRLSRPHGQESRYKQTKDDEQNHCDDLREKRVFLFDGHNDDETGANEEYETTQEISGEQSQPLEESSPVHDHQNAGDRQYCDHRVDLRGDHGHSQQRQDQR